MYSIVYVFTQRGRRRWRIQAHVYIKQFYELNHISLTSGNKKQVVAEMSFAHFIRFYYYYYYILG